MRTDIINVPFVALFYSLRNLIYYRKERQITEDRFIHLTESNDLRLARRALTDAMLATVGLRVVDDDKDTIPWYIMVSRVQKSWIKKVSTYGYKVGLNQPDQP